MFTTLIVQPIFNLLVLIYALIPGHNFGLAIILFTLVVRLAMWPLVKKQINQAKAMRELAPELKKIKAAAGGDRQKESKMTMELYKEKEINPFASLGIVLVQLPVLIGLYSGLNRIIKNPHQIVSFSYPALHHLGWLQTLGANIHRFDNSLFGLVNLSRPALDKGKIYWPALLIVALSAIGQFLQSRQLMPQSKDSRSLKAILTEAGQGKKADQTEVNAAVSRGTLFLIPGFVFLIGLHFASALPLYWLATSSIAYWQQSRILGEDVAEADSSVPTSGGVKITYSKAAPPTSAKRQKSKRKKR